MGEQNFHKEVGNVAGGNIYQYYQHSPDGKPLLGSQKWVAKKYWFGTRITAGWLVLLSSLICLPCLARGSVVLLVFVRHIFWTHETTGFWLLNVVPLILILCVIRFTVIVWRVYLHEFTQIDGTLSADARDADGYVFRGKLGGEGTICPICKAKLEFHSAKFQNGLGRLPDSANERLFDFDMDVEVHPFLRCTRNSAHEWPFDFTMIQD